MSIKLTVPDGFDTVPNEQQIEYVQELWDRIAADAERVPVPPEHKRIIAERLDAYTAEPKRGRPWSEVRGELLAKLRESRIESESSQRQGWTPKRLPIGIRCDESTSE